MTGEATQQPNIVLFFHRKEMMPDGSIGCVEITARADNANAQCRLRLTVAQARALADEILRRAGIVEPAT